MDQSSDTLGINILSNAISDGGCDFYRVRWPLEAIKRNGLGEYLVMEGAWTEEDYFRNIRDADVLITRRGGEDRMNMIQNFPTTKPEVGEKLKVKDKLFVFDHDDNTFKILPTNDYYKYLGTEEVKAKNPLTGKEEWLWKDGENGFNLKRNREYAEKLLKSLISADLVTTTTEHIAELFRAFNPNVTVLPNCIDFTKFRALEFKKDKWIRIAWQGGSSHFEDLAEINPALVEIFKKHKNVRLVLYGNWWDGATKGIPEDRIDRYPWVKTIAHPYFMSTLNVDIAVIPLVDTEFNHYKSEVKFSEFSALKVPSVVRNILPYSVVCKDGENALCYDNNRDLVQKLSSLIESPELRTKIADNAYKWVKENRDIDKNANLWIDAYKEAIEARRNRTNK